MYEYRDYTAYCIFCDKGEKQVRLRVGVGCAGYSEGIDLFPTGCKFTYWECKECGKQNSVHTSSAQEVCFPDEYVPGHWREAKKEDG